MQLAPAIKYNTLSWFQTSSGERPFVVSPFLSLGDALLLQRLRNVSTPLQIERTSAGIDLACANRNPLLLSLVPPQLLHLRPAPGRKRPRPRRSHPAPHPPPQPRSRRDPALPRPRRTPGPPRHLAKTAHLQRQEYLPPKRLPPLQRPARSAPPRQYLQTGRLRPPSPRSPSGASTARPWPCPIQPYGPSKPPTHPTWKSSTSA